MAKDEHELEAAEGADARGAGMKRLILARRARFVAAALATAGIAAASCEDGSEPAGDMGGAANVAPPETPPQVCLTSGGIGTGGMVGGTTGGVGGMPPPQVCLSGGSVPYPPVVPDAGPPDDDGGALPQPCLV